MISTKEAYRKILDIIAPLPEQHVMLKDSVSFILSKDVVSPINMPPFRQSAMDGFAVHKHHLATYQLIDEIKAGDNKHPSLKQGEAVRIFTGAAVPDTANAVVMQEKITVKDDQITSQEPIVQGSNIRPEGEQVKQGEIALKKGTKLTPAAVGFLASLGITKVFVYKKPSIAIIATGNELISPGKTLEYGQIYESNSIMLASALKHLDFSNFEHYKIDDNYENTYTLLQTAIASHDVIILTGGISVGEYDFVGKALKALSVKEVFYKVKQKPGKPLFFGTKGNATIFALPGNPAAALSCFYVYVYTALNRLKGNINYKIEYSEKKSTTAFKKRGNRAQFLKAIINDEHVSILEGQSSAMLQTFALANGLVYLPEDIAKIDIGDNVKVIPLPNN